MNLCILACLAPEVGDGVGVGVTDRLLPLLKIEAGLLEAAKIDFTSI